MSHPSLQADTDDEFVTDRLFPLKTNSWHGWMEDD